MFFKVVIFIITAVFFYALGDDNGTKYTSDIISKKIEECKDLEDLKIQLKMKGAKWSTINYNEKCKELIESEYCTGCNKLEDINFVGDDNCSYIKEIENYRKWRIDYGRNSRKDSRNNAWNRKYRLFKLYQKEGKPKKNK